MPNYQGVWSLSEQYQNASDWGDLTSTREAYSGASNSVRAVFSGGASNAHGGLQ
jgi:hypothetical protein